MKPRVEFRIEGGPLDEMSIAQLLADVFSQELTGSLIVEGLEHRLSAVRFAGGLVTQVSGFWQTAPLVRGALGLFLPSESLAFVDQHATRYGVDLFSAVEQLSLLPGDSLRLAKEAFVSRGIEKLSELSLGGAYRFRSGSERLKGAPCLEPGLVPFGLVIAALLADPRAPATRAAEQFGDDVLCVANSKLSTLRAVLSGPARAVVENVSRKGRTLRALEQLNLVTKESLHAIVYGLWLSGQLFAAPARATSSSPPSDKNFRALKEQALEAKVMEAWAVAEADPSRVEKASAFASKAASVFPHNPRLQFFSASLHQRAQRFEQARAGFERVLQLDPSHGDARRELTALKHVGAGRRLFGKG